MTIGRDPQREQLELFHAFSGELPARDAQNLMAYPFFSLAKSKRTILYFDAGIGGLHHLYMAAGMNKAIIDTSAAHPEVTVPLNAKLVQNEIETARDQIRRLVRQGKPFDPDAMMQPFVAVGFPLKNARQQLTALLGLTAGVSMGFNASDGD